MTCYRVFPGIDLVYNDIHMQSSGMKPAMHGNFLEINHCREGRAECECGDQFYYITAGDLSSSSGRTAAMRLIIRSAIITASPF